MEEIKDRRSLNAKHFLIRYAKGKQICRMDAHVGHIHYKDKQTRKFEGVDCRFTPTDYGWEMKKNNYELEIPKKADGWFRFINSCQVDPRTGEDWDISDEVVAIKPLGVFPIEGQLISKPEWPNKGIVLYKDAYGQDIDLEAMALNTGFVKEIIIHKKPADLSKDLEFSFEVGVTDFEIKPKVKNLYQAKKAALAVIETKRRNLEKSGRFREARQENRTLIRETERWEGELEREVWDRKNPLITSDSVILKRIRKTWFRKFRLYDAKENQGIVNIRLERRDGRIILTKILDKAFLESAVYPVRTDALTNYYSGAGDGGAAIYEGATWDAAHDALTAESVDNINYISARVQYQEAPGPSGFGIIRGFIPVDTSGLPDTAIIGEPTRLYEWLFDVIDQDDDGDDWVVVVQTFQASTAAVAVEDFDTCGDLVDDPTEGSDRKDLTGLTEGQYHYWTLDATGRGWISKTGYTKLGRREGHDCLDNSPRTDFECVNDFESHQSVHADTDEDPYLAVTYEVPGWTGKVSGVTNPAKVMGVDVANIAKVKGVA